MPCNSYHVFIKEIRQSVSIPVLSIIEETVKFLKKNDFKKVGVIATSITSKSRIYANAFVENAITYEAPDDFQQAKMGKCVMNLVLGTHTNKDREELIQTIASFEEKMLIAWY